MRQSEFAPYALIVMGGLFGLSAVFDRGRNSATDFTVIVGLFVGLGLFALRKQKHARALIAGHTGKIVSSAVQGAVARLQKEWEWVLAIPPPREIQLTHKGRNSLVRGIFGIVFVDAMLALCVLGNWWVFQKEHGPLAAKLIRPILIFCVVLGALYTLFSSGLLIRYHTRARHLLAHGQAAIGKIVSLSEFDSKPTLNIEFRQASGEVSRARCYGATAACFEGMTMPVFYNPGKPKDSFVFLEGGDYEIIRPGLSNASALYI